MKMDIDEFHRLYWQQTFNEGWMLSQSYDGTYGICASGRTLAASPGGTIQDMIDLDRSWVAAVVLRAIYEGHPCHVEAARIHYAGLNPILMDIPFIQMENGSTITFNRDHPIPEVSWKEPECSTCEGHGDVWTGWKTELCPAVGCSFRDKAAETGMAASTEVEPVEHRVWHTGVVRYGVGGQRIETGIGEVQIRITGEKKMDIETFAKMAKAATESQLGSAMMIFKGLPGSAAAYAGLNNAMMVAQWVENSNPVQVYNLLHDVGIGKYEEVILAEIDRDAIQPVVKVSDLTFHPISGGFPRNKYLLLRGPSGYSVIPHRYIVAKHDEEFRPLQPWVDHAGDSVTDGGEMPTHWTYL